MIKKFYNSHKYIWVAIIYFIGYLPWYFGIQQRDMTGFHDVSVHLDHIIPFVPWFVDFYMYWFLFVFGTFLFVFFYDKNEWYKACAMMFGGMTICLIIFTIFPSTFAYRPAVITGTPVEKFFLNIVYTADKPTNVFPSIHVYNSIGCAIALIKSKRFKGNTKIKIFAIASAIMITLSTTFIKQHSVLDALGAAVIAIVLYYVVYVRFDAYLEAKKEKKTVLESIKNSQ